MLTIADAKKPSAVAGVMGGEYSGIVDDTNMIVFESACFNGPSVRTTCHNRFSLGCAADDNLPALNKFMVKCVHRLAVLQHDIVGDVNNVIDRADCVPKLPDGLKSSLIPQPASLRLSGPASW